MHCSPSCDAEEEDTDLINDTYDDLVCDTSASSATSSLDYSSQASKEDDSPATTHDPSLSSLPSPPHRTSLPGTHLDLVSSITEGYREGVSWKRGCLLGSGATASCFKATDLRTGFKMAVKQV